MPEYEAHNMLWAAWNAAKTDHDIFVKIDADTILNRSSALEEICQLFKQPDVTGVQIPLHDFFTDELINGLNAFSPLVTFEPSRLRLYADHADRGHKKVLKGTEVQFLAPIGWHGKYPKPLQAFHYGFHRRLKNQNATLQRLASAWLDHGDREREWAIAGAASARWWMRSGALGYKGFWFKKCYNRCLDDSFRRVLVSTTVARLK